MDAIDILINEHVYIKKVLSAIEDDCIKLSEGKDADPQFYRKVIEFVRGYADKYHHQKEEKKLFNILAEADDNLKRGPVMGMLLEHDLGRSYISSLEIAVEDYEKGDKSKKAYIIANALIYAEMLKKHIEKEDSNIYMLSRRIIDSETQKDLKNEFDEIEEDEANKKIREKYTAFADSLIKS
ncbi:hypothetical protein OXPF_40520 [Oxobacter pfennigii]|uniref:Hemerythrin-like domain-containing protein n=1 Tax=Oxobacter pfennigii TaxID=36849 RepID=A0A0P8W486_9CLOT|nr:hemerythrin domain-containing protein [Oxobacter pfennigii]KPU42267.1 hypothetical protein OXPF_40520 [Oxobacter pfennigii]